MAVAEHVQRLRTLARQALADLFDQSDPFGRLTLVQVFMLAGDTLVTISLAGSLFFSISPDEAKSKVFLYLVFTLLPFAIVSPFLGPLIDRSRGARRAMVVASAAGRAVICPFMARDIHSLLLFPEAFLILVLSKLYLVTRGALVPEMEAAGQVGPRRTARGQAPEPDEVVRPPSFFHGEMMGFPSEPEDVPAEQPERLQYAALNARLTLIGTLSGFVFSIPGVILLKLAGAPGVLVFTTLVFVTAAVCGLRLPVLRHVRRVAGTSGPPAEAVRPVPVVRGRARDDLSVLQPMADPEVLLGLTTMSIIRGLAGFLVFLLAFGLRRLHAPLWWYGLALGMSGVGALVGLSLVPRLRHRLAEQQIVLIGIALIAVCAFGAALWGSLLAQVVLAAMVGVAGAVAQPSFDAMTQRLVPLAAQGRAFARFAMRQQLVWVVGAIFPVVFAFSLVQGDVIMAVVGAAGTVFYVVSRRALRGRALPRPRHGH